MITALEVATGVVATACGLVGGSFFILSAFLMRALGDLPDSQGTAAMQQMNVRAVTPVFMTAMFGTGAACLALLAWVMTSGDGVAKAWTAVGIVLYILGCLGVTIARNVPLNNQLAAQRAGTTEADAVWRHYLHAWTRWNSLRSLAAMLACVSLIAAIAVR